MVIKHFFLIFFLSGLLFFKESYPIEAENCYISVDTLGTTFGIPKLDYFLENPTKSVASLFVCSVITYFAYTFYQSKITQIQNQLQDKNDKIEQKLEDARLEIERELEESRLQMEKEFEDAQIEFEESLKTEYQRQWNIEWQNEVEKLHKTNSEAQDMVKSNVQIFMPGDIETTFEDVAGMLDAKSDLEDIKSFLINPESFEAIGARIPKGVLLSGPPGVGKTFLARALAGEVNCPFLYMSASAFTEMYTGRGAARVRDLFKTARELAPCIIFIDEFDAVAYRRDYGGGSSGETEHVQTLNQLLAEMDGFNQNENPIVVIAATNRADVLDEAVRRPGRFDKTVAISLPSLIDRRKIILTYLEKIQHEDDINVDLIARGTTSFSGAELAQLINDAALIAVRLGKSVVSMQDIEESLDVMIMGGKERSDSMELTQEDLWQTAVHETGHALMRVYETHSVSLYKVTIRPRGNALGITFGMRDRDTYSRYKENMIAEICVSLGGSVAEELVFGGRGSGISSDLKQARAIAKQMVMRFGMASEFKDISFSEYIGREYELPAEIAAAIHREIAYIIHECREHVTKVLQEHMKQLLEVSEQLMLKGTLFASEVYQICGEKEPVIEHNFVNIP